MKKIIPLKSFFKMNEKNLHPNFSKFNRINFIIELTQEKIKNKVSDGRGINTIQNSLEYWEARREYVLKVNYKVSLKDIAKMRVL